MTDEQEIVYLVRIKGEPAIFKCRLHASAEHWLETQSPDGKVYIYEKRMYKAVGSCVDALSLFEEVCDLESERLRREAGRIENLRAVVEDRTVPRPELPPLDESPI